MVGLGGKFTVYTISCGWAENLDTELMWGV